MGEAVDGFRQHDAHGAVDAGSEEPALQETLIAENVDERDGREQRRREKRSHCHGHEEPAAGHAATRQRIGVEEEASGTTMSATRLDTQMEFHSEATRAGVEM